MMMTFHFARSLSVAMLGLAAVLPAHAASVVSFNGWQPIKPARADSLAGPGKGGKSNHGFRFATPNAVTVLTKSGVGTSAFGAVTINVGTSTPSGGTLSLSSGAITKTGTATLNLESSDFYTLNLSGTGVSTTPLGGVHTSIVSGGTLSAGGSGGSLFLSGTSPTRVNGTINLLAPLGGLSIVSGGTVQLRPNVVTNLGLLSGSLNTFGGTLTVVDSNAANFSLSTGSVLTSIGSGTLTLQGGNTFGLNGTRGVHVLAGTLDIETSQTLAALEIGPGATVILGNGAISPPAGGGVQDATSQNSQPVPEPSAAMLCMLSAVGLIARRRRVWQVLASSFSGS